MTNLRLTDCEVGTIAHRPSTRLLPPRWCHRGHFLPNYQSGDCVACQKINHYRHCPPTKRPQNRMRRFSSYAAAREAWFERGGWLLDLGGGAYGVTDNVAVVRRLRGTAWMRRCDRLECWDETDLTPASVAA